MELAETQSVSRGRWVQWLAPGFVGSALGWMTHWVVTTGISWTTLIWLVLTMVVAAVAVAFTPLPGFEVLRPGTSFTGAWQWQRSPVRQGLAMGTTVLIALAMWETNERWSGSVGWTVGVPWLAAMVLLGLCAWWPDLGWPGWMLPANWTRKGAIGWLIVGGMAFGTRLVWPGKYPAIVDGDEGVFLRMAKEARAGEIGNPFATGWLDVPNLYPAAMGWLSHLTGDSLGGLRVLMALIGSVTVVATWRFGRQVVGSEAALIGALLLAIMPFHLMFSRTAIFHATDPAALALTLLFLIRAVRFNRAGDAWLAGVMVGLGWYGYWGARSLPIIVAVVLLLVARPFWRVATLGGWAAAGFLVTIAPMIITFFHHRPAFSGRIAMTPITNTSEWQANPLQAVLIHLQQALFRPLSESSMMFYRHDAPMIGWPEAILLVLGVAGLLGALLRSKEWRTAVWLIVPVVVLMGVLGAVDIVDAHRLLLITPLWALVMGVGVMLVASWLADTPLLRVNRTKITTWVATAMVAVLMAVNLPWVYSNDRIVENWGDPRTVAAWDLGWRLSAGSESSEVLLAGPPFVYANSNPAFAFEAPQAVVTTIDEPMRQVEDVPSLTPGVVLVVIPERLEERCTIDQALPDALVFEVHAQDGTLLYVTYGSAPMSGWSIATSPAGTSVTMTGPATCAEASKARSVTVKNRLLEPSL